MLGFLKPDPFQDAILGEFRRERGRWSGRFELPPHGAVELRISGGRRAPDPASLRVAASLLTQYVALRSAMAVALFEHYQPGHEAWKAGELEGMVEDLPELSSSEDVWAHVTVDYVDVDASRRDFQTEVRMRAAWDEEHTLGVRLTDGRLIELCGSVGP